MTGIGLVTAPFHKQADGDATIRAQEQHAPITLHPAAVVVEGDVEALVQPIFYSPAVPVGLEPLGGIELVGRETDPSTRVWLTFHRPRIINLQRVQTLYLKIIG